MDRFWFTLVFCFGYSLSEIYHLIRGQETDFTNEFFVIPAIITFSFLSYIWLDKKIFS